MSEKRAVVYLRVSTDRQNTDNQLPVLGEYAASHSLHIIGTYQEEVTAWRNGHQIELKKLVFAASRRKFEVLLVWALDRLSREGPLAILQLVDKLRAYGVKVISYQEPWTEAPGEIGEVLYAIAGWVARMESERRSERIKSGLARRFRQGGHIGRKPGAKDRGTRSKLGYYLRHHGGKIASA